MVTLLDYDQVAELLGVNYQTVSRLVTSGQLAAVQVGVKKRSKRIHPDDLERFIAERRGVSVPQSVPVRPDIRRHSGRLSYTVRALKPSTKRVN
jgi:excisionase family DNA binding protein